MERQAIWYPHPKSEPKSKCYANYLAIEVREGRMSSELRSAIIEEKRLAIAGGTTGGRQLRINS